MKKFFALILSVGLISATGLTAQSSYPFPAAPPGTNYGPSQQSYGPSQQGNQINWLRNYSEAVSLSQSTSKPIAILFTGTSWCPACMKLERTVLNHPEFTQRVAQKFIFLKAEFHDYSEGAVASSPYKPLLDRYGVNAFPTIVVVDASGRTLFTVNYRDGGPQVYAQELLNKLGGARRASY